MTRKQKEMGYNSYLPGKLLVRVFKLLDTHNHLQNADNNHNRVCCQVNDDGYRHSIYLLTSSPTPPGDAS